MADDLIVVGGGQAAASVVAGVRARGDQRPITLITDEPDPPYQRPPLSKRYLLGAVPASRLLLRPLEWYRDNGIVLRLGERAAGIDRAQRMVRLASGELLAYGSLVLATGATPRTLPAAIGGDLDGVHTLRSRADADALGRELKSGRDLVVIGGGYIGLEVAASATGAGVRVVVVEMAERILQRVAAAETSDYFRNLHTGRGVAVHESTGLTRLIGNEGRVQAAELSDGTVLGADLVVVGIGVRPNDDLAQAAGLATDDGILVDGACRTSDPSILAAGDCARFPRGRGHIRLESVQNASDQARAAAGTLCGDEITYDPVPWFWSDQFDVKLKIAGYSAGHDMVATRPGRRDGACSVWYYRDGTLIAVDSMNDAASHTMARRLIAAGASPPPEQVRDPACDLKSLVPAGA